MSGPHDNKLRHSIKHLREKSVDSKISLFVDDINGVAYAHDMQVDLIEIHTGRFSNGIQKNNMSVIGDIKKMIDSALDKNLLINAGHDLNLNNLHYLVEIGNINEVSIGHAIIIDSLNYGFENTISKYLDIIRK